MDWLVYNHCVINPLTVRDAQRSQYQPDQAARQPRRRVLFLSQQRHFYKGSAYISRLVYKYPDSARQVPGCG
jgi:hypothetical protein